jgi:hypothetical protein
VSAALLEAPARPATVRAGGETAGGSRATLEELLEATWHGALGQGQAECPVCRATMRMEGGGAHCRGCGSALS